MSENFKSGRESGECCGESSQPLTEAPHEQRPSIDPERCPLCAAPNECGLQKGHVKCWCYGVNVSEAALARVPEDARDRACLCRPCATGKTNPSMIARHLHELHRGR